MRCLNLGGSYNFFWGWQSPELAGIVGLYCCYFLPLSQQPVALNNFTPVKSFGLQKASSGLLRRSPFHACENRRGQKWQIPAFGSEPHRRRDAYLGLTGPV